MVHPSKQSEAALLSGVVPAEIVLGYLLCPFWGWIGVDSYGSVKIVRFGGFAVGEGRKREAPQVIKLSRCQRRGESNHLFVTQSPYHNWLFQTIRCTAHPTSFVTQHSENISYMLTGQV